MDIDIAGGLILDTVSLDACSIGSCKPRVDTISTSNQHFSCRTEIKMNIWTHDGGIFND